MAEINITPALRIASDPHQWVVQKKEGDKWAGLSYHTTLPHAVASLGQYMLRRSEAETFEQLIKDAAEITRVIKLAIPSVPDFQQGA